MTDKEIKIPESFESVHDVLHYMQINLRAPKNQYNKFSEFYYRSCEDILEGIKKVLPSGAHVTICDDLVEICGKVYIKSTATLLYKGLIVSNAAFARETEARPKFDAAQLTGSASSYARKYSLNGLFLIDDTKDPDAHENKEEKASNNAQSKAAAKQEPKKEQAPANPLKLLADKIGQQLRASNTIEVLDYVWKGFGDDLAKIKEASPNAAYPALVKIYQDMTAKLVESPIEVDEIQY